VSCPSDEDGNKSSDSSEERRIVLQY